MILCILTDAAWSHVAYSLQNPSLNSICKLWARIEFKVVLEQCLPVKSGGITPPP